MRLIDADALIKDLNEAKDRFMDMEEARVEIELDGAGVVRAANTFFVQVIAAAPTVDAAPEVHGRWIEEGCIQICSNCGEEHEWQDYRAPYCENCGAKMTEERDNEQI